MSDFEVSYRTGDTETGWENPSACMERALADELLPVRMPASYKGQKSYPGHFWMSAMDEHLMYESKLEMAILLHLDFNPKVVNVVPQPFKMRFQRATRVYHHIPDFFVKYENGAGEVVNVKPSKWVNTERNQRSFNACASLSAEMGFSYSTRSEPDPLFMSNLWWLGGYRRRPSAMEDHTEFLLECASESMCIEDVLAKAKNSLLLRPILFHALWKQYLSVDLTCLLSTKSRITLPSKMQGKE
jgi:hypothetical protein